MNNVTYRPAEERDLGDAAELFISTVNDMLKRNGLPPAPYAPASIEPVYRHIFRTGIFEVGEVDGKVGLICHATVRDHVWFLSGFWTRSDLQRRGLGGPLLRRVMDEGRRRGATLSFTWSSIDYAALATYLKRGLLPGFPVLTFAGMPRAPRALDARYEAATLTVDAASAIDRDVRGTSREIDHLFWLGGAAAGHEVRCEGRTVGYYYVTNGTIGPAAWIDPEHGDAVLELALGDASARARDVRIVGLGANHTAIRFALGAGLSLVSTAHLVHSQPFGRLDRYVPSGPSLF